MCERRTGFYPLEALDAVGKTTTLSLLQERGYTVVRTPPAQFDKFRPIFNDSDLRLRYLFYLMGVMYTGANVASLRRDEIVYCDRYLLTTVAAHEAMGLSQKWLSLCQPVIDRIERPDMTFLLTCSNEERIRRLNGRGADRVDVQNLAFNDEILKGYFRWSEQLNYPLKVVDTSNLAPSDVANILENY